MTNQQGLELGAACRETEARFNAWADASRVTMSPDAATEKLLEFASPAVLEGMRAGNVIVLTNKYGGAWFSVSW